MYIFLKTEKTVSGAIYRTGSSTDSLRKGDSNELKEILI